MLKNLPLLLIFSMLPVTALALKRPACSINTAGPTPVIYFGGYKSTDADAQAWADSAQSNPKYAAQFKFQGFSLNGAASNKASVLQATQAHIMNCVDAINSENFKGPIVLVGHSDGAWVINEIVQKVKPENRGKIKLVNLDGYASSGEAFANVDVQCWTAYMTEKQGTAPASCGAIAPSAKSLYTHEMAKCKSGSCHFLGESGCSSNWCLHFRTMNKRAAGDLGNANYATKGYLSVQPPLQYLNKFLSPENLKGVSDEGNKDAGARRL